MRNNTVLIIKTKIMKKLFLFLLLVIAMSCSMTAMSTGPQTKVKKERSVVMRKEKCTIREGCDALLYFLLENGKVFSRTMDANKETFLEPGDTIVYQETTKGSIYIISIKWKKCKK